MSADNWAVCPRCEQHRQSQLKSERAAVASLYGTVPVEEFDAARTAFAAVEAEPPARTFREDYEFYGVEEGTLCISYRGGCNVCGLKFEHKSEHPLPI